MNPWIWESRPLGKPWRSRVTSWIASSSPSQLPLHSRKILLRKQGVPLFSHLCIVHRVGIRTKAPLQSITRFTIDCTRIRIGTLISKTMVTILSYSERKRHSKNALFNQTSLYPRYPLVLVRERKLDLLQESKHLNSNSLQEHSSSSSKISKRSRPRSKRTRSAWEKSRN